jgi:anti-sigma-K factor RskA
MHDDLALYVLGALEDPTEFEAHLETCEQCRAELAELRGTLDVLDAGIVRTPAPVGLRAKTMSAIRATAVREPDGAAPAPAPPADNVISIERARLRRARFVSIAAVAALAVVVAGVGYRSITREGFAADRTILLSALDGGAARGEARIDDTAAGQVIELTVSGLPDAPAGMYYECWWVGPNDADDIQDRVSAGTFRGGNGTYRMQSSADPAHFTKMGVTLEPDDGNPARTGTKVLVSQPPPGTTPAPSPAPPTTAPTALPTTAPTAPPSAAPTTPPTAAPSPSAAAPSASSI